MSVGWWKKHPFFLCLCATNLLCHAFVPSASQSAVTRVLFPKNSLWKTVPGNSVTAKHVLQRGNDNLHNGKSANGDEPSQSELDAAAAEKAEEQMKSVRLLMGVTARRPDIESGQRYGSGDWLVNLLSLPNSFVLKRIKFHLISNTLISFLVVLINRYFFPLSIPLVAHNLLGGFLGLLLVFRTSTAYERFWEARQIWSTTMTTCRNLAITASTQIKYFAPQSATKLLKYLMAFPDALSYTSLSGDIPMSNRVMRLVPAHFRDQAAGPATYLCMMMQRMLIHAQVEAPASGVDICQARYQMEASACIQKLTEAITDCETIVRTPVPWSYSRHTSRFLTVWSGTLPLALVNTFGWLTIPIVMIGSWCLFGIEEIGHLIEQPFVSDDVVLSQGFLTLADRLELKNKAYDIGIPVEQLAWKISAQIAELTIAATQLEDPAVVPPSAGFA